MKNLLIISILIILFSASCRTNAEEFSKFDQIFTQNNKTVEPENPATINLEYTEDDINLKVGIVEEDSDNICFRTKNGDLTENTPITIITSLNEKPQKILNAKVKTKVEEGCSRRASEITDKNLGKNFYYFLVLTDTKLDEYQEIFGIGLIEPYASVEIEKNSAKVDLNSDGVDEFFRKCTGYEGVLFTIWSGKVLKGKRLWESFYYLDYDTEPSCTKEELEESVDSKIGNVEIGNKCVRLFIANEKLMVGDKVQIVLPESPSQKILQAEIIEYSECKDEYFGDLEPDNPYTKLTPYLLNLSDQSGKNNGFGIGIVNVNTQTKLEKGMATIDLNEDGKNEYFRECTSNEGLHLTVWTGKPLKGKRIWHSYYNFSYDTKPNCKVKDYEETDF